MCQRLIAMGPAHGILVWVGAAPCHSVQGLRRSVLVLRSKTQQAARQKGCVVLHSVVHNCDVCCLGRSSTGGRSSREVAKDSQEDMSAAE